MQIRKLKSSQKMSSFLKGLKTTLSSFNAQSPAENAETTVELDSKVTTTSLEETSESRKDDVPSEEKLRPNQLANKFLGMAMKASSKLQEKATNISAIVNERTIMGNIEKERQKFKEELQKEKSCAAGGEVADLLTNPIAQKHIISISANPKNFIEDPPVTSDFEADIVLVKACASELFKLDPRLKDVRFDLVPKQVSEEKFWRNYTYRISLIKKFLDEKEGTKEQANLQESGNECHQQMNEEKDKTQEQKKDESPEFDEDQLEKELLNDLEEFEVVDEGAKKSEDSDELNKEIDALLGSGN